MDTDYASRLTQADYVSNLAEKEFERQCLGAGVNAKNVDAALATMAEMETEEHGKRLPVRERPPSGMRAPIRTRESQTI